MKVLEFRCHWVHWWEWLFFYLSLECLCGTRLIGLANFDQGYSSFFFLSVCTQPTLVHLIDIPNSISQIEYSILFFYCFNSSFFYIIVLNARLNVNIKNFYFCVFLWIQFSK